jgi:VWFA-related protein
MRLRIALLGLMVPTLLAAQQPGELPRFRAGTNLVRVDAYVSKDDVAVEDLKVEDFDVYEDDKLQAVESFSLVKARAPIPQSERTNPTNVRDMQQAAQDAARVFTLFFDPVYVSLSGSYHARKPIIETLDRVIGEDDLVGVMTPEMPVSAITYSRRTTSIENAVTKTWYWGRRDSIIETPQEQAIRQCYPASGNDRDLAGEMIARMSERQTLRALEALVIHLDGLRPERKFVMVFTEGWPLFRMNENLARRVEGRVPMTDPPSTDPRTGGLFRPGSTDPQTGGQTMEACDRMRTELAYIDHEVEFRELLQRANRANVSFYPIDPRGLVAFDDPIGPGRPAGPVSDMRRLSSRQDGLRTLAADTDGTVVLNTDIERALPRLLTDVGAYYLLGYVSTNPKLDGRYRRLTVRVKRPGVELRARPGYLAPTAAEVAAGQTPSAAATSGPPSTVREALSRLPGGRTPPPLYLQAAGGSGYLQITVELDRAIAAAPEWAKGGTIRVEVGPADTSGKDRRVEELVLAAGQRVYALRHPARDLLAPGRYQVRAQLTASGARSPLTLSTVATVPAAEALLGTAAIASRRGPGTGRLFQPTADPRFRRTERLVVETPLLASDATVSARLLNRLGQPMAVPVTLAERIDESLQLRVSLAELALAPLAPGEYVVEVTATKGTATSTVSYGFRVVP